MGWFGMNKKCIKDEQLYFFIFNEFKNKGEREKIEKHLNECILCQKKLNKALKVIKLLNQNKEKLNERSFDYEKNNLYVFKYFRFAIYTMLFIVLFLFFPNFDSISVIKKGLIKKESELSINYFEEKIYEFEIMQVVLTGGDEYE